jgi:hypothetical protein
VKQEGGQYEKRNALPKIEKTRQTDTLQNFWQVIYVFFIKKTGFERKPLEHSY